MGLDAETKGLRHWAPPQPGDWRARGPWLEGVPAFAAAASGRGVGGARSAAGPAPRAQPGGLLAAPASRAGGARAEDPAPDPEIASKIGRASCRERVSSPV